MAELVDRWPEMSSLVYALSEARQKRELTGQPGPSGWVMTARTYRHIVAVMMAQRNRRATVLGKNINPSAGAVQLFEMPVRFVEQGFLKDGEFDLLYDSW